MDILQIIENTIKTHSLICEGDKVLVALSGGSDSVLLLRILCSLSEKHNFTVAAAHINHMLRDTADRDEEFSKKLCGELGVKFYVRKADIKSLSKSAKMGEEQFARNFRYEFFESLGYDKIATAHNKNDVAETLLFNFMRGAGIKGLSGIPYKRGNIIRPLLDVKKMDVTAYCNENGFAYVTDETNLTPVYSRNKIRLNLIPEIEKEFNSAFVDVVTANARHINEDSDFLESLARQSYHGEVTCEMQQALAKPIFTRVLLLYYKDVSGKESNLPLVYLDKIAELVRNNKTGHKIHLPFNMEAEMEYGRLIIRKKSEKISFEYSITPGEVLNIPEIGKNILITETDGKWDFRIEDTAGLKIRSRQKGDVFFPSGMQGRKKLSDYFTDKKIPAGERDRIPLLVKENDLVLVVGYRQDRRFQKNGKGYKIEIMEENDAN